MSGRGWNVVVLVGRCAAIAVAAFAATWIALAAVSS